MVTIYALKPAFQNWLRPLVVRLAAWGVTPNQVTVLSGVASLLLGWDLARGSHSWILLPLFLPVRMALNAIDGMLAREYQMTTRSGAILNEALDIVSDAALTLPLATVAGVSAVGIGFATVAALLVEVAGFVSPGVRRYDGPFGKSDRALALGLAGSWLGLSGPPTKLAAELLPWVWIALCVVTAVNRLRKLKV